MVVSVDEAANYHAASCSSEQITIQPKTVQNPEIILSQDSYKYDGTEKTPTVTVKDEDKIIPSTEYTVSYSDNKNAGTATVTISSKSGGNYVVSGSKDFTITKVDSAELTTEELTVSGVYGTKTGKLAITGGKVTTTDGKEIAGTWTVTDTASHDMEKLLTVEETEICTLTFTPEDNNYPQLTAEVTPTIKKRPAKVTVNQVSRKYKEADPEFTYTVVTEEGYPALVGSDNLGITLTTTGNGEIFRWNLRYYRNRIQSEL